jgi:hypothetical protein
MKRDLKLLLEEVDKKVGKKISLSSDFEKLSAIFSKHHVFLNSAVLMKVWGHVMSADKPSPETLDKIALFVGFQSWNDFREALHGDDDGQTNYETDEKK